MTKEYISCLRFFEEFYYLQDDNENVLELLNPTNATRFSCAEDAINFAKENTSMGEYVVAISVEEAFEKWKQFISPDNSRRSFKKVNESFSRKYDPKKDTLLDVLKMHVVMRENDNSVRYEDYETWPELHQLYQHIFSIESWNSKDYEQICYSFSMKIDKEKKNNLEKKFDIKIFKEELNTIIPFITRKDDDGYYIIEIFDHFLCEGGNSCSFYYKNDNDCFIEGRYMSKVGKNLEECLFYWKKNRYY